MAETSDISLPSNSCLPDTGEVLKPPPGWESVLWRALVSVGLLLAAWIIGKLGAIGWFGGVGSENDVVTGIIALAAALVASVPLLIKGFKGIFSDDPSATLSQLAGVAVLAALVTGGFVTAVIVALALDLGHLAEERGIRHAGAAIESLVKLTARTAHRISGKVENDIQSDRLVPDDRVAVYPGEVIPADGIVEHGFSAINPAHLTGESTPVDVHPGDEVHHGTINLTGKIEVLVKRVRGETSLGRVIEALRSAEESRPPIVRSLERFAGMLLPVVILIAAATFVLTRDISRAIAVIIVACPCALVLSSPAAMIPALAVAVRKGILVKSGAFLERAANVVTLILDKTGTVTLGELSVQEFLPVEGIEQADLEKAARIAASGSRHPVALAISKDGEVKAVVESEEIPGKGVSVTYRDVVYRLGRRKWVAARTNATREFEERADNHPGPSTWVSCDGKFVGLVLLSDQPRPEIQEALDEMTELGIEKRVLLTGDRRDVAEELAARIGFDRVEAEVLPEAKNDLVDEEMELLGGSERRREGRKGVMYVGDGVNDALALRKADVGIALGAMGSEVALQSADIALMTNDLRLLPYLVRLSRRVHATIRTNVYVGVSFSMLMLLLALVGIITPIWGAILHHGGTLFVIGNSLRLLNEEGEEEHL